MAGTIATYSDLQSAVTEYLARDQDATLTARIPWFIQAFEAKMNRSLFVRQMESRVTAITTYGVTDCEFVALPSDFQSMRPIRISSVEGKPILSFMSTVQMDEYRARQGDVADQPLFFSIFGSEIELAPTPDKAYTLEMIYRQNVPALASNSTNWLLTLASDLYLYGSLLETAPYIKDDGRLQTWGSLYNSALNDLNALGRASAFNAGPMAVRVSGRVW